MLIKKSCTYLIVVIFSITNVYCTLSPTKRSKTGKTVVQELKSGPQKTSVHDLNLVNLNTNSGDILTNQAAFCLPCSKKARNKTDIVLGYVTPWNSHGYDVAKIWAKKFTHISPVWLQINPDYTIKGQHDIDKGWIQDVKNAGGKTKVVPRIIFENWNKAAFERASGNTARLIEKLTDLCKEHKFNGLVLEFWIQGISVGAPVGWLIRIVTKIGREMKNEGLDIFLAIPPMRGENYIPFTAEHYDTLYEHITGFSLMTYDYSSVGRPGPNAPIKWVRSSIEVLKKGYDRPLDKVLLGINLYGMDYTLNGGGAITANRYLEILKELSSDKKLKWDSNSQEHYFEVRLTDGRHTVFYPTLYSLNIRLALANELECGLSFWELGQGLDYFYDLL